VQVDKAGIAHAQEAVQLDTPGGGERASGASARQLPLVDAVVLADAHRVAGFDAHITEGPGHSAVVPVADHVPVAVVAAL